jgi:hypothetical protein
VTQCRFSDLRMRLRANERRGVSDTSMSFHHFGVSSHKHRAAVRPVVAVSVQRPGLDLCGVAESVDLTQPAGQWVRTRTNLVHHISNPPQGTERAVVPRFDQRWAARIGAGRITALFR